MIPQPAITHLTLLSNSPILHLQWNLHRIFRFHSTRCQISDSQFKSLHFYEDTPHARIEPRLQWNYVTVGTSNIVTIPLNQ